jgi:hypothetical protein
LTIVLSTGFCRKAGAEFKKMHTEKINESEKVEELPDEWWYRVYLGVIITTIIVILSLGLFSEHFSS